MQKGFKVNVNGKKFKVYADGDGLTALAADDQISYHKKSIFDLANTICAEEQKKLKNEEDKAELNPYLLLSKMLRRSAKL